MSLALSTLTLDDLAGMTLDSDLATMTLDATASIIIAFVTASGGYTGIIGGKMDSNTIEAVAGSTVHLMARLYKLDATLLTTSDVSAARVDVYIIDDYEDSRVAVDDTDTAITDGSAYATPSVSSVVHSSLQTDAAWIYDSVGYDVSYDFTPLSVDTVYDVRLTLTLTGATIVARWLVCSH